MLVRTKFLGATEYKGTRVKAISLFDSVTIGYYDAHDATRGALAALIEKIIKDGVVFLTEDEKDADKWRREYFDGEYWFVSPE